MVRNTGNQSPEPLRITISGKNDRLAVESFLTLAEETVHILRAIDKTSPDRDEKLNWFIESASKASPLTMEIGANDADSKRTNRAIQLFVGAVEVMNHSPTRPDGFPVGALHRLSKIVNLLNDGVGEISFGVGRKKVKPTQHILANICIILDPHEIRTSIEGQLDSVWVHGKRQFRIWHPRTGDSVLCRFSQKFDDYVRDGLFKRVSVSGMAAYEGGVPKHIVVEKMFILEDDGIAFDNLPPINMTGGRSASEHLRRVRDAE